MLKGRDFTFPSPGSMIIGQYIGSSTMDQVQMLEKAV